VRVGIADEQGFKTSDEFVLSTTDLPFLIASISSDMEASISLVANCAVEILLSIMSDSYLTKSEGYCLQRGSLQSDCWSA
jgi:hypothetical protein